MLVRSANHPSAVTATVRAAVALSAILLGCALVLTVGFAPVAEVHNATHDTRHATGFPCH